MNLSKSKILPLFNEWLLAWNEHNLNEVMKLFHDDIVFEHWTGTKVIGKDLLRKLWMPWFLNHGNFKFIEEDTFFDEEEQKILFTWRLEWPSQLKAYRGKPEIRRGVDVLYFEDGKIIQKHSYSKTTIQIDESSITLSK